MINTGAEQISMAIMCLIEFGKKIIQGDKRIDINSLIGTDTIGSEKMTADIPLSKA